MKNQGENKIGALALSMKEEDDDTEVLIGDDIVIRLIRARRGRAKVLFKVPKGTPVKRRKLTY
jgi:sRNA-binding carbon storage regulator CsrA